MSDKLTPKQEAFARHVAEGDTYAAAYRKAYSAANMSDAVIRNEASKLMNNRDISVMVMELQEAANVQTQYTIEKAMTELEEARLLGMKEGQVSSAVSAIEKKAKLNGLFEKDNMQGFKLPPMQISCLLYTSPSPRDGLLSRMPSSA